MFGNPGGQALAVWILPGLLSESQQPDLQLLIELGAGRFIGGSLFQGQAHLQEELMELIMERKPLAVWGQMIGERVPLHCGHWKPIGAGVTVKLPHGPEAI